MGGVTGPRSAGCGGRTRSRSGVVVVVVDGGAGSPTGPDEVGPSWDDPLYKATTSRIEKINYDGCVYAITWFRVG